MTIADARDTKDGSVAADLRSLLLDFAAFAGRKGIVTAFFLLLGALLEGLSLMLLVPLLAIVIGSEVPSGRLAQAMAALFAFFHIEQPLGKLALLFGLFGLLLLVRAMVLYLRDMGMARLRTAFTESHRLRVVERLAAAPWDRIVQLRHARVTQLMSGDIQRIAVAAGVVLQMTTSLAMLLAQCVLVFLLAPAMALIAFLVLAVAAVAFALVARRAHALGGATTQTNLVLMDSVSQFLGGLKLAISQNLQGGFVAEFRETLRTQAQQQIDFVRQQTTSRLALSTVAGIAGGLLVMVGFGVLHIAPATLITLLLVITRMTGPTGQIQQSVQQLAHALPVYRRVKVLERELAAIAHAPEGSGGPSVALDGPIVFDNVSFRHSADEDDEVPRGVRGVTLVIRPGETIGVTGASGAGKTTFVDLLVGLYPPDEGRISVGGVSLRGTTLAAWRDRVSYISQDAFLFHDTVARNLAWAAPGASQAEMWRALDLVGAGALVRGMPQGLDTVVGERGTLISGGERQRIALARALLRKPSLLVLDEATAAIDIAGERAILNALRMLDPRPTLIIVAHRAESLTACERVLRFEGGRRIEDKVAIRV